jgi:hypothetical protein
MPSPTEVHWVGVRHPRALLIAPNINSAMSRAVGKLAFTHLNLAPLRQGLGAVQVAGFLGALPRTGRLRCTPNGSKAGESYRHSSAEGLSPCLRA